MKKTLTQEEISSLCYELSLLLNDDSDIQTEDALDILVKESDPAYQEMLKDMRDKVKDGDTLAKAMEETGRFPAYVCGLVNVGEKKSLGKALSAIVRYYEDRIRMNQRIRSALLYPAVMLMLMLLVIAVLLIRVLPIFDDVYASLGGRLTGIAGGLLVMGRWLDRIMPVLWVFLAVLAVFLGAFAAVPAFREKVMMFWRNRRGDKGLSRQMNNAMAAKAMAMGLETDMMSIDEAVELASEVLGDVPAARERCLKCRQRLDEGAQTGEALEESGLLPPRACHLLEMGSTKEAEVMDKIAEDLYQKSEAALEETVSRVEPALVMVCSVLVGLILLSVMLPLMHIMSAIG